VYKCWVNCGRIEGMRKKRYCANCGKVVPGKGKYCCYMCSFPATIDSIVQMKKKEGSIYEKWKGRWEAATGLKMKGEK